MFCYEAGFSVTSVSIFIPCKEFDPKLISQEKKMILEPLRQKCGIKWNLPKKISSVNFNKSEKLFFESS